MKPYLRLLIMTALICCLSVEAHPASSTQSYLFKNSVLKSQPIQYAPFLLAQQSQDSISVKNMRSLKLKSPYMAIFYSIIPGIFIHGSGHFYAGKTNTGTLLFGAEAAGVLITYLGFLSSFRGIENQDDTDLMGLVGVVLFAGSWVYDVIGSPIAVRKQNRKLIQNSNTELKLQPGKIGLHLSFVFYF